MIPNKILYSKFNWHIFSACTIYSILDVDLELESIEVLDETRLLDSNNSVRSRSQSISTLSITPYPIEDEKAISFIGALKIPVCIYN